MKLRWIGQSGYILKSGKTEIIIDPYLSDIVNTVENRPRLVEPPIAASEIKADAVICTHSHIDHLDPEAAKEMKENQYFITTADGCSVLDTLGRKNHSSLAEGEKLTVGDFTVYGVYAKHTVDAIGIVIEAEGKRLYFSGDTLFDEKLFLVSEYKPDYTFICINGKLGNMDVKHAVITARNIGAKVNIPNHYGMFATNTEDPKKFTDNLDNGCILEFNREYDIKDIK